MNFINLRKYGRSKLTEAQQSFLCRLAPAGQLIQDHTLIKSNFMRVPSPAGILASVVIADILIVSQWGTHPVSKKRYLNKAANNLSLLKTSEFWLKHTVSYEKEEYRCYNDWGEYCRDVSDYYVYSGKYGGILGCRDQRQQIDKFSYTREEQAKHKDQMLILIRDLGLDEFDIHYG